MGLESRQGIERKEIKGLEQTKWWVITGGPSTGKSTLLANLGQRGYKTMPEAARVVIDEGIAAARTVQQIRENETQFQVDVLRLKERWEDRIPPQELVLGDRGLLWHIGYHHMVRNPREIDQIYIQKKF